MLIPVFSVRGRRLNDKFKMQPGEVAEKLHGPKNAKVKRTCGRTQNRLARFARTFRVPSRNAGAHCFSPCRLGGPVGGGFQALNHGGQGVNAMANGVASNDGFARRGLRAGTAPGVRTVGRRPGRGLRGWRRGRGTVLVGGRHGQKRLWANRVKRVAPRDVVAEMIKGQSARLRCRAVGTATPRQFATRFCACQPTQPCAFHFSHPPACLTALAPTHSHPPGVRRSSNRWVASHGPPLNSRLSNSTGKISRRLIPGFASIMTPALRVIINHLPTQFSVNHLSPEILFQLN